MWLKIEILWFWMTNSYEKFMCFWFQSLSLWTLWTKPISMIIILSASVCWFADLWSFSASSSFLLIYCFWRLWNNLIPSLWSQLFHLHSISWSFGLWSFYFFCFIFFLFSLDDQWNESWRKFICDANLELESQEAINPVGLFFWFDQSIWLWDLCRTRIQSLDQIFPFYLFMYLFICSGLLGGRDFIRQTCLDRYLRLIKHEFIGNLIYLMFCLLGFQLLIYFLF